MAVPAYNTSSFKPARKIVVAVDASEQAEYALKFYLDHLCQEKDQVMLLHIPERDLPTGAEITTYWEEMIGAEDDGVDELQTKLMKLTENHGIITTFKTHNGSPGESIVAVSEETGADMVVMGTRGLGVLRRTILGSVSDYVLHHAHCPVMICRSGQV